MRRIEFAKPTLRHLLFGSLSCLMLMAWGPTFSAESEPAGVDEERIVQRLKEEIMQEFRNSDFLQEQIQIGIRNYILEQQQARAKAEQDQQGQADRLASNIRPVSADRDHINGNPDADISIVEYSDFECPFCKRFHPTVKRLVETYDGKVNWVYRHFPLSFHNPGAQKQAEASECATELGGNEAFWAYSDAIYERTSAGGRGFPIENLVPLAVELGLDGDKFNECLDSGRFTARVLADFEEGSSIGIRGTPGNILLDNRNGKTLVRSGALPYAALKADLDNLLTETEASQN